MRHTHLHAAHAELVDAERYERAGKAATEAHRLGQRSHGKRSAPSVCQRHEGFADEVEHLPASEELARIRSSLEALAQKESLLDSTGVCKRKRAESIVRGNALRSWEACHGVADILPGADDVVPELSSAAPWPGPLEGDSMTLLKWPCPAAALAAKVLAGIEAKDRDEAVTGAKTFLQNAWEQRSHGILFENCAPISVTVPRDHICYIALRCLCQTPQGRNTMRFVRALASVLVGGRNAMLSKGNPARQWYNDAKAVFRVYRKGRQDELRRKYVWSHLSYGNLSSGLFYVLRLDPVEATCFGEDVREITLQVVVEPVHFWTIFEDVDVSKDFDGEVWRIKESQTLLTHVVPNAVDLFRPDPASPTSPCARGCPRRRCQKDERRAVWNRVIAAISRRARGRRNLCATWRSGC